MNKNICRICHKRLGCKWDSYDNEKWILGLIFCAGWNFSQMNIKNDEGVISSQCPYWLEHIVLDQMEVNP